jgi:RNA-splicing ligase RtcB
MPTPLQGTDFEIKVRGYSNDDLAYWFEHVDEMERHFAYAKRRSRFTRAEKQIIKTEVARRLRHNIYKA